MAYRYYSSLRPIGIGCYPKPDDNQVIIIVNYDDRTYVEEADHMAWGYIEYEKPLDKMEAKHYSFIQAKTTSDKKTFAEFLKETEWYDGELIIDDLESEFSFVWDNDYWFTEAGEKKFSLILNGIFTENDGCLEVTTDGATESQIDAFNALVAGWVSQNVYDKYIYDKRGADNDN